MVAKNRDGRVIKVEGNPLHPVNSGRLCARGQASVQGVYNPDRFTGPARRLSDGTQVPVSWEEGQKMVLAALAPSSLPGPRGEILFLSDLTTGSELRMVNRFLASMGPSNHLMYEPLAYEPLRRASAEIFGTGAIPSYRIDKADFLLSFGADFLETWVSNVRFARQFSKFREPGEHGKHPFYYVGPRINITAANADHWIPAGPGSQWVVAFAVVHSLLELDYAPALSRDDAARLKNLVAPFTPAYVQKKSGVKKEVIDSICASFMKAERPLIIAEGTGYQDGLALETARAAHLLSSLVAGSAETIDFSRAQALSATAAAGEIKARIGAMREGKVRLLFILRANPSFHLPRDWGFEESVKKVPFVVTMGSFPDETSRLAHLILPTHTFLESWGDWEPERGIRGLIQPVTGPVFDTKTPGDILLSLGKAFRGTTAFPEKDFYEVLRNSWDSRDGEKEGNERQKAWETALRQGGSWDEHEGPAKKPASRPSFTNLKLPIPGPDQVPAGNGLSFFSYPMVQFFDGRSANRPVLQELPDPITAITWGGWVEINPHTAKRLHISQGEVLTISSGGTSVRAPAYLFPGIMPDVLAMPLGHGHTRFGRYATGGTLNPALLLGNRLDSAGGIIRPLLSAAVARSGEREVFAHMDGSSDQHGRAIARSLDWDHYVEKGSSPPEVILPLEKGYKGSRDLYAPHLHDTYRWAMAVDLDRCIGCGACVAACYMENNVGIVGRDQVIKGRIMAWLHIQRYFEEEEPRIRFLPMLCQHCDEAPCEAVCPVFAPHHSREGINNQVYNRCIGTRFCNQNCPYKARRFNWFTWKREAPLEWQLNPDVTVRTKGVMEKCSFCIQRINDARIKARSEGRLIADGEFAPACAQTCPADALIFGNLKDPASRVARLTDAGRAYQVLGELNTKPGVIYLQKITQCRM
jgi:molybdopterin-containing oxidoreductase family iron-sulfur binding subunit